MPPSHAQTRGYREPMDMLRVGATFPNPPFNGVGDQGCRGGGGLDIDLVGAVGAAMGVAVEFAAYHGADFDGILDALAAGEYDCVASGIAVTPACEKKVAFAPPYLITGQALAVDTNRRPCVRSVDDLAGLTIAVQHGSTAQAAAEGLVAEGLAAQVRIYGGASIGPGGIRAALHDLTTGGCDAVLELAPVLTEMVNVTEGVELVQRGITTENIAIAVARSNPRLLRRIAATQAELEADGTLQRIRRKWVGNPFTDQSLAVH